jgi:hypothetical protein
VQYYALKLAMFGKAKASAASASAETSPLNSSSLPFLIYHVLALSGSTGFFRLIAIFGRPFLEIRPSTIH